MKFRQFINEASVDKPLNYSGIRLSNVLEIFSAHCKDSLWMVENDTPLYRGDSSFQSDYIIRMVYVSDTERKSQSIPNFYTTLMDNLPSWKEYPKRSRSLICTGSSDVANLFSGINHTNSVFVVIPFDNVPIGISQDTDIWDIRLDKRVSGIKGIIFLSQFHLLMKALGISSDGNLWNNVNKFANDLKDFDFSNKLFVELKTDGSIYGKALSSAFNNFKSDFIGWLDDILNPINLGITMGTSKTLSTKMKFDSECWVNGNCLVIQYSEWDKVRNEILANK